MLENCFLIDWLALTFREYSSPAEVLEFLQLRDDITFQSMAGRYMYKYRLSFGGIHILFGHRNPDQDFPMLELSGQGCREFETYSSFGLENLLSLCLDTKRYHLSRVDIAFDDHSGVFDISEVCKDTFEGNYCSRSCNATIYDQIRKRLHGFSVMFGVKSSDMYLRIYDKARERGFKDGRHWIRCELVLKQERATEFVKNPLPIGEKFRGAITNYLRFCVPSSDSNKRRWDTRQYWLDFIDNAEKISLFSKKEVDYNLSRLSRYVFHQAGNSIDTYIRCEGLISFLEQLVERGSKLSPRQKYLIEQSRLLIQDNKAITRDDLEVIDKNYSIITKENYKL